MAEKVGLPQSHISKIESGHVDIRLSSLIELARVLDLELSLVPRKLVPAVRSIIRTSETEQLASAESMRKAVRRLDRIHALSVDLARTYKQINEFARLARLAEQLKAFPAIAQRLGELEKVNNQLKRYQKGIEDLSSVQNTLRELQSVRNKLAHAVQDSSHVAEPPPPAYRLDEDEAHGDG